MIKTVRFKTVLDGIYLVKCAEDSVMVSRKTDPSGQIGSSIFCDTHVCQGWTNSTVFASRTSGKALLPLRYLRGGSED